MSSLPSTSAAAPVASTPRGASSAAFMAAGRPRPLGPTPTAPSTAGSSSSTGARAMRPNSASTSAAGGAAGASSPLSPGTAPRGMAPVSAPHQQQPSMGGGMLGTLAPGTLVRVGAYTCTIKRYLSQGGFAHVYLVTVPTAISMPPPAKPTTQLVLKRMAVPDKEALVIVRNEVETHKQLRSHPYIAHFLEASASTLQAPAGSAPGSAAGGYEIFILMEYCPGGGLIDLMNARLRNRLRESEILHIFSQVCEGVAHMHHQQPPILHRDLKVENILLVPPPNSNGPPSSLASCANNAESIAFKLCDFGSAVGIKSRVPPASMEAARALEADLNRHTTLQYRAPEMVDVYRRPPVAIGEPADIWALGVLLYKLCYYTTPFEENGGGPLAILNVRYRFPPQPAYSDSLKNLIKSILVEQPDSRPSIDQLRVNVARLRHTSPPADALKRLAQEDSTSVASAASRFPALEDIGIGKLSIASSSSSSAASSPGPLRSPSSPGLPPLPARTAASAARSVAVADDLISFRDDHAPNGAGREMDKELRELEAQMDGKATMRRGRPTKAAAGSVVADAISAFSSSKPALPSSSGKATTKPFSDTFSSTSSSSFVPFDFKKTSSAEVSPIIGSSSPGVAPVKPVEKRHTLISTSPPPEAFKVSARPVADRVADFSSASQALEPSKTTVSPVNDKSSLMAKSPGPISTLSTVAPLEARRAVTPSTSVVDDGPALSSSVPVLVPIRSYSQSGPSPGPTRPSATTNAETRPASKPVPQVLDEDAAGMEPTMPALMPIKAQLRSQGVETSLPPMSMSMSMRTKSSPVPVLHAPVARVAAKMAANAAVSSSSPPGIIRPKPWKPTAHRPGPVQQTTKYLKPVPNVGLVKSSSAAVLDRLGGVVGGDDEDGADKGATAGASRPASGAKDATTSYPLPAGRTEEAPKLSSNGNQPGMGADGDEPGQDGGKAGPEASQAASNTDTTAANSAADEQPFRGVSDLIARWQAHAENPTSNTMGAGAGALAGAGGAGSGDATGRRARLPGRDI